jgi:hypothetical protein
MNCQSSNVFWSIEVECVYCDSCHMKDVHKIIDIITINACIKNSGLISIKFYI